MASQTASVYVLESIVRGHHVYKRMWTPHLGEQLRIQSEENENDPRAVAVLKDRVVVGHLPRESALFTSAAMPGDSLASSAVGSLLTDFK